MNTIIDIVLTNSERLLLREIELAIAPSHLQGAFKRIRRDATQDQYIATLNRTEIGQLQACITGNTIYLGHVPAAARSRQSIVRKLDGFRTILTAPQRGIPTKTVEV